MRAQLQSRTADVRDAPLSTNHGAGASCVTPWPLGRGCHHDTDDSCGAVGVACVACAVTFKWVQHQPNPDDKPGPDFKAMNRLAAVRCAN